MHNTLNYAEHLRAHGFRLTPQREMILDAVCEGGGPTHLEDIVARVQAKSPAVNLSTVYRALHFFSEMELVVAAEVDGRKVYEIAPGIPYHRLICRRCGGVIPLDHHEAEAFLALVTEHYGFVLDACHLALSGLCRDCARLEDEAPTPAPPCS
jgi:Fe2+ or Zn2+ uptake regulation protein